MSTSRGILLSALFIALRLTPIGMALVFISQTSSLPADQIAHITDLLVRCLLVLVTWNMSEGAFMLWIRERTAGSQSAAGHAVAAIFFGLLVLVSLLAFRWQSSQIDFLVLLGALSLRGSARSSWENGRPRTGVCTAVAAHTVATALSFLIVLNDHLPWEAAILSLGVGASVGALEVSWYADTLRTARDRWLVPVYRVALVLAPTVVGVLALLGRFPTLYFSAYLLVLIAAKALKRLTIDGQIAPDGFKIVAGLHLLFAALMIACRVYS